MPVTLHHQRTVRCEEISVSHGRGVLSSEERRRFERRRSRYAAP
jgi:hypothetical protein